MPMKLCEHYPCHKTSGISFHCEFCYCPEYDLEKCSGKPEYIVKNSKTIKDCSNCLIPHSSEYITKYYIDKKV
jgi:Zn-finger protein